MPSSVVKVKLTDSPIPTVPCNISTVTLASGSLSLYVYDVGENPTTNPGMWRRKEGEVLVGNKKVMEDRIEIHVGILKNIENNTLVKKYIYIYYSLLSSSDISTDATAGAILILFAGPTEERDAVKFSEPSALLSLTIVTGTDCEVLTLLNVMVVVGS